MGFSLLDGKKFVIVSGSDRILERVYKNKPVWTISGSRAKLYSTRASAQKCIKDNDIYGEVHQFQELYVPVYLVTRVSNETKRIMADLVWVHRNSDYQNPPYYQTPDKAQEALDREKLLLINQYQEIIMYCQSLKLPEFI
jgi:hypothetical protein